MKTLELTQGSSAMSEEQPYREEWMSDDQYECYAFLADLFMGWHHLNGKVHNWGGGIKFNTTQTSSFGTFDFDGLTRAVITAHDKMIRFSIEPSGPGMLALICHKRHLREGSMHERHPTIEEAIGQMRNRTVLQPTQAKGK